MELKLNTTVCLTLMIVLIVPISLAEEMPSKGVDLTKFIVEGKTLSIQKPIEDAKLVVYGSVINFKGISSGSVAKDQFDLVLSKDQDKILIESGVAARARAVNIPAGSRIKFKDGILTIIPPQKDLPVVEVPSGASVTFKEGVYAVEGKSGVNFKVGSVILQGNVAVDKEHIAVLKGGVLGLDNSRFIAKTDVVFTVKGTEVGFEGAVSLSGYHGNRMTTIAGKGSVDVSDFFVSMTSGKVEEDRISIEKNSPFQVALADTKQEIENGAFFSFPSINIEKVGVGFKHEAVETEFVGDVSGKLIVYALSDSDKMIDVPYNTKGGKLLVDMSAARTLAREPGLSNALVRLSVSDSPAAYYFGGAVEPGEIRPVMEDPETPFSNIQQVETGASFVSREDEVDLASKGRVPAAYARLSQRRVYPEEQPEHFDTFKGYFEEMAKDEPPRFRSLAAQNGMESLISGLDNPISKKDAMNSISEELARRYGTSNPIKDSIMDRATTGDEIDYGELDKIVEAETFILRNAIVSDTKNLRESLAAMGTFIYSEKGQKMLRDPSTIRVLNEALEAAASGDFEKIRQASYDLKALGAPHPEKLLSTYMGLPRSSGNPNAKDWQLAADSISAVADAYSAITTGAPLTGEDIKILKKAGKEYGSLVPQILDALEASRRQKELIMRGLDYAQQVPETDTVLNQLGVLSLSNWESRHGMVNLKNVEPETVVGAGIALGMYGKEYSLPIPASAELSVLTSDPEDMSRNKPLFIRDEIMGSVLKVVKKDGQLFFVSPSKTEEDSVRNFRQVLSPEQRTEFYSQNNLIEIRSGSMLAGALPQGLLQAAKENTDFGQAMGPYFGTVLFRKMDSLEGLEKDIATRRVVINGKLVSISDYLFKNEDYQFYKNLGQRIQSERALFKAGAATQVKTVSPPAPSGSFVPAQQRLTALQQKARNLFISAY